MRLRRILAAMLAACGSTPPHASTDRPAEGPALPATPEPALPTIPPASNGCVGDAEDDAAHTPVWQDVLHYDQAWFARGVARRGWTELDARLVNRIGHSTHPGFDIMSGELFLREREPGVLEDEHGQRWLKTRLRYRCAGEHPHFAIDPHQGVFEIVHAPRCGETRDIHVCGNYGAPGCGHDPGDQDAASIAEWWFVAAPAGARWLGIQPVAVADPMPTCFRLIPNRVSKPP